jgi:signal transduction histidine kinase
MGDIVWAINPKRDRLSDVVHRMRRFANDACTARDIALVFKTPARDEDLKLGPDVRRELYLVLKESINNAARHSGCSRVDAELRISNDRLVLEVRDDGRGFDTAAEFEGHGLASMKRRAEKLRGELLVESRPGGGTTIRLEAPISGRRRFRWFTFLPA